MKNIIIIVLLGTIWSSCTSFVTIQKTLPPEIHIARDSTTFLFVDRFDPDLLEFNNQNKVDVFKMGRNSFVKGLKMGFDSSSYYHLIVADTVIPGRSAHEPANQLSSEQVSELCEGISYLLTLDNYDLYFDQEVEVYEDEDGSKDRTAYYDLVVNTYITLYGNDGVIIDKLKDELRIAHDERSVLSGLLAVGPSMGKADKNAKLISEELGRKFIQKFYPLEIQEMREFFNVKPFENVYRNFQLENWNAVEEELLKYAENRDSKIAGRASYNLAVFYENLGKEAEMDFWYKNAVDKLGSKTPELAPNFPIVE